MSDSLKDFRGLILRPNKMAWFMFIDESGQDRKNSPYEVLAGVAIHDGTLWPLIRQLHEAEVSCFGRRYSSGNSELKGTKILKRKVFQHANLNCSVVRQDIPTLAKECLDDGANFNTVRHFKALALAKIEYVDKVFSICEAFGCKIFASVVETDSPETTSGGLRKDYAYLFQRFFYFLEDEGNQTGRTERGVLVFDELEKSKSHIFIDQSHAYFLETATGRARADLIVPEPFFVHSDLTTGVQIADLVAYCISWCFRTPRMTKPARQELSQFDGYIARMRYRTQRLVQGNPKFEIWSIAHIADLRTNLEKLDDEEE